jgi:iron(III) transport system substrate-binding protein
MRGGLLMIALYANWKRPVLLTRCRGSLIDIRDVMPIIRSATLAILLPLAIGRLFCYAAAAGDTVLDGAKYEGEVVYYASMNLGEANALIAEFEKRYPSIKVKLNRSGSEKLLTKVLTETRAKKNFADVIQTVEFSMHVFQRSGVLARYTPQANSLYPQEFKDDGYWTTVYYNPYVVGYNTRLVPLPTVPTSYTDLLDSKWRGKMMMEGTKAEWFAGVLQIMGRERGLKYMHELARQQPVVREGHELLAQLIAAGEAALDVNIPAASVERLKEKGAPIDWVSVGESPAVMVGIGLSAQAPHPNAGKVFLDFVLSREGQKIMQAPGRLVARRDLATEQAAISKRIKMVPLRPALADKLDDFAKQLRAIFGG